MDILSYAMAKNSASGTIEEAIASLPKGIIYKGAVNYENNLPNNPSVGDAYTVLYRGTSGEEVNGQEYVWGKYNNVNQWIVFGPDMSQYQEKLVSGTNIKTVNGNSILGSGNVVVSTYQPFPASWPTTNSSTTKQFCDVVDADNTATIGMGYFGGASWSDKPAGLSNGDVVVEILEGPNSTKSIHLIMTSSSVYPYRWEYTYWSHGSTSGWRGVQPEITSNNKLSADLVDDTSTTHKFVTTSEKSTWNSKQDAINDLSDIRSGAALGATALQSAPVTSVNSKTGAVTLSASDVGADPSGSASTVQGNLNTHTSDSVSHITAAERTTWNAKYSMPLGGVPKNQLADDVTASLNKADTALQSAPVTSVNSYVGDVSLSASDVGAIPSSERGAVNGVATLDSSGKVPSSQLPSGSGLPSGGQYGNILWINYNGVPDWYSSVVTDISPDLEGPGLFIDYSNGNRNHISIESGNIFLQIMNSPVTGYGELFSTLFTMAKTSPGTKVGLKGCGIMGVEVYQRSLQIVSDVGLVPIISMYINDQGSAVVFMAKNFDVEDATKEFGGRLIGSFYYEGNFYDDIYQYQITIQFHYNGEIFVSCVAFNNYTALPNQDTPINVTEEDIRVGVGNISYTDLKDSANRSADFDISGTNTTYTGEWTSSNYFNVRYQGVLYNYEIIWDDQEEKFDISFRNFSLD